MFASDDNSGYIFVVEHNGGMLTFSDDNEEKARNQAIAFNALGKERLAELDKDAKIHGTRYTVAGGHVTKNEFDNAVAGI